MKATIFAVACAALSLSASALAAPTLSTQSNAAVTTSRGDVDQTTPIATVQKYAQVCLVNSTGRAVLVGTSWFGESSHLTAIPVNGKHIYRLEMTGTIPTDHAVKTLSVQYRARGIFTQWNSADLELPYSYVDSDDCTELPNYKFAYVSTGTGTYLALLPVVSAAN